MKIEFTFDNITQLEELYYAVENIPSEILEDEKKTGNTSKRGATTVWSHNEIKI